MAQTHATLAVAEQLAVLDETLGDLINAVDRAAPGSQLNEMIAGVADAVRSRR